MEYFVKREVRAGWSQYKATAYVFHGQKVQGKYSSLTFRDTHGEAIAGTAWEAMTALCHDAQHDVGDTNYKYFPRMKIGTWVITCAPVEPYVPKRVMEHTQDLALDLSHRLQSAFEEIERLENGATRIKRTLKNYQRAVSDRSGEENSIDVRTWTTMSPIRFHTRYPPAKRCRTDDTRRTVSGNG